MPAAKPLKTDTISTGSRTKILATIGPAVNSSAAILTLIDNGADGFRLNFSHGDHEERVKQIAWIRKASKNQAKPIAIVQDLQGPKVRLGDFDGIINVHKGQTLTFKYKADYQESGHIPTQYDLAKKVKRGESLHLYDGKIHCQVTSVQAGIVHAEASNNGILIKRKGINLPDTDFGGDIITAKDKADLVFGSTQDIDYVALSFIQSAEDIEKLRDMLKNLNSTAKIIAKIETKSAVENIEEIVRTADAVMIARGDLAVETTPESVPIVQRQIIGLGLKYATPTIVATQMLGTMTENPEPTRAEVSDVATAAILGADCVMLSDETASGQYPVEAVKVMKRVIDYAEQHMPLTINYTANTEDHSKQASISKAVINLAEHIGAKAIVAETKSGATALQIAALRSNIPLIAVTSDNRTAGQLALVSGVRSFVRPVDPLAASKLTSWLQSRKLFNKGDIIVSASGQYPGVVGTTDTIKVRVLK